MVSATNGWLRNICYLFVESTLGEILSQTDFSEYFAPLRLSKENSTCFNSELNILVCVSSLASGYRYRVLSVSKLLVLVLGGALSE